MSLSQTEVASSPVEPDREMDPDRTAASEEEKVPVLPTWRLIVLSISLCFGLLLALMDTTIVATSIYTIGTEFHNLSSATWVALAYALSYLGCAVIFARMGDVYGRRNTYVAAFVIFFAFSLGCGFAQSLNQLIACRVLQGIGGSGLYSLTMVIFTEIIPISKNRWIGGIIGAVVAASGVFGPVLGGIITRYTTWRWIFWINAPIGILPLVCFVIAWPKPGQIYHARRRPLSELDVVGSFLLIAASVLVVFAIQEGGLKYGTFSKPLFIAPIVIGSICWILLFSWEALVARRWEQKFATMFPLRLIRRRVYLSGVISTLLTGFSYLLVIYALPIHFQVVNGRNALTASLSILPMLISSAIGSMAGGAFNGRINRTFHTLLAGSIFILLGDGLLSTLPSSTPMPAKAYGFQVFLGLGFGLTISTASIIATIECEWRDRAVAQGIVAQSRTLGGSIGIAASTAMLAVLQNDRLISKGVITSMQLASLEDSIRSMNPVQIEAVRGVYSKAFKQDMWLSTAVAAFGVLAALGTWQKAPMELAEAQRLQIEEGMRGQNAAEKRPEKQQNGNSIEKAPEITDTTV